MEISKAAPFIARFIRRVQESKNVWTFYFERPENYNFVPGQYNRVSLDIDAKDDRGNNRQFTISSSPTDKDFITITTKIEEKKSDFKNEFFNLQENSGVIFFGPLGGFYLREENKIPRVFLAGGIGITPFHSMIKYVYDKNLNIPITLIVSFSTVEEIIFHIQLTEIAHENKNIKIIYTISHPEKSKKPWDGEVGRITENLIKKYVSDIRSSEFMVVGPPPMVDSTFEILQKMNIKEDKIKVEHFTGY